MNNLLEIAINLNNTALSHISLLSRETVLHALSTSAMKAELHQAWGSMGTSFWFTQRLLQVNGQANTNSQINVSKLVKCTTRSYVINSCKKRNRRRVFVFVSPASENKERMEEEGTVIFGITAELWLSARAKETEEIRRFFLRWICEEARERKTDEQWDREEKKFSQDVLPVCT